MEIEWYWLAEQLGLVKNTSQLYNDSSVYYEVSAKADDVFQTLILSFILVLFLLGFLIRFFATLKKHEVAGQKILCGGMVLLLVYAVLLAVGIGPYIIFYPRGGGFIDLDVLGHIVEGMYFVILALALFLGGRFGYFLAKKYSKRI